MADQTRFIVYACPTGPLAEQLDGYYAAARAAVGPNSAHEYMPHITLTGFFRDAPEAAPRYVAALEEALRHARPAQPDPPLVITGVEYSREFHGLLIESLWLRQLAADFTERAHSPTRVEAIRLKDWLHLSLAYGFAPEHHEPLAAIGRERVDLAAPAGWELRLYERRATGGWQLHAAWALS